MRFADIAREQDRIEIKQLLDGCSCQGAKPAKKRKAPKPFNTPRPIKPIKHIRPVKPVTLAEPTTPRAKRARAAATS